jgi:predicted DNA-binding transcriptional regulator AlpA
VNHKRSDKFLTDRDAAVITGMKVSTLRKWRMFGRGPRFRRLGRSIRYSVADIRAWLDSRPMGGSTEGQ